MNDLRDMGDFPVSVYMGATGNILLTIILTYIVRGKVGARHGAHHETGLALPMWASGMISANILPVILLRSGMDRDAPYPEIRNMDFFGDQHRFASWVYAVASANMLVWIVLSWSLFSHRRDGQTLAGMMALAFICTFFPAWIRLFKDQ